MFIAEPVFEFGRGHVYEFAENGVKKLGSFRVNSRNRFWGITTGKCEDRGVILRICEGGVNMFGKCRTGRIEVVKV